MEQLITILSGICPDVDFSKEEQLIDDGILGSFDVLEILEELNDTFGVSIQIPDIVPDNFNSTERIMNLIKRLQGE